MCVFWMFHFGVGTPIVRTPKDEGMHHDDLKCGQLSHGRLLQTCYNQRNTTEVSTNMCVMHKTKRDKLAENKSWD